MHTYRQILPTQPVVLRFATRQELPRKNMPGKESFLQVAGLILFPQKKPKILAYIFFKRKFLQVGFQFNLSLTIFVLLDKQKSLRQPQGHTLEVLLHFFDDDLTLKY